MACGTWVICLEGGGVFPAGGQGDGKDTGRYTQGFKGQTGSGQRDPGWAGEGERSAAFQWRRQEATGSWAARRLVRPECATLEGDRWEMKPGLGCGLQKVLNARLALQLHPGRPKTSFVRCTPASAFPRRADATAPLCVLTAQAAAEVRSYVGQVSLQYFLRVWTGQGRAPHQAHSSGRKIWFLPTKSL